jgi:hypothetical protein
MFPPLLPSLLVVLYNAQGVDPDKPDVEFPCDFNSVEVIQRERVERDSLKISRF